jgi:formamidopyrimidine-DNA glycosylase
VPELPEVETVRRQLIDVVRGETISSARVSGHRTIRRQPVEEFVARIGDRVINDVRRWGKFLLFELDDTSMLVIHLRMSGKLLYTKDLLLEKSPHTHAILDLASGAQLRFVDPRTFGELFIADEFDERGLPLEIAHLGLDPVNEEFSRSFLDVLVANRRVAIKTLLLDQRKIAGVGNIYGDEICFCARVRPTRLAMSLTRVERQRIVTATPKILEAAILERGSSLRDETYRDLFGGLGTYQQHHQVYGRGGLACYACGTEIRRVTVGGRSAHFCPHCQC